MGCVYSNNGMQIPHDSPLDLILKHWHSLTGRTTPLIAKELVQLCTEIWLIQKFEGGGAWPRFGSLESELIAELLSELPSQRRWQELRYAELFAIFLNRSEAYEPEKDCFAQVLRGKRKARKEEPLARLICVDKSNMADVDMVAPFFLGGCTLSLLPPLLSPLVGVGGPPQQQQLERRQEQGRATTAPDHPEGGDEGRDRGGAHLLPPPCRTAPVRAKGAPPGWRLANVTPSASGISLD